MGEEQKTQLQEIYDALISGKSLKITITNIMQHYQAVNSTGQTNNTTEKFIILVKNKVATIDNVSAGGYYGGPFDAYRVVSTNIEFEEISE